MLVARAIPFRRVHDINELLVCLAGGGLVIPEPLKNAVDLSLYAVDARYPGSLEPMDKTEFIEAMQRAEAVVAWAERVLREKMDGS